MDEKISECYKCSGLHEIEQIAMRSVCLEMSSNMFIILFRVEIDYSRPKTSLSDKNSLSTGSVSVWSSFYPEATWSPRVPPKTKKNLAYSNNNKFVRITNECSDSGKLVRQRQSLRPLF